MVRIALFLFAIAFQVFTFMHPLCAQAGELPAYLRDRGTGLPVSMFGTYIRKGELLVYPFFEHDRDDNFEYKPAELGFGIESDFRGKYRASEGLIFIGYGITDWMAVEVEAAVIKATLEKAADDPSAMPEKIEESGTGDLEGQLRFRLLRESGQRPEVFGFLEAVSPQQKDKVLIGTPDWEFKVGTGVIKGFSFGTMTLRAAVDYSVEESKAELGEYAIEYLRRLSPAWRIFLGIEGSQDEASLITEAQWILTETIFIKLNSGFGITSKAIDWAPEIGVMFSFPLKSE